MAKIINGKEISEFVKSNIAKHIIWHPLNNVKRVTYIG